MCVRVFICVDKVSNTFGIENFFQKESNTFVSKTFRIENFSYRKLLVPYSVSKTFRIENFWCYISYRKLFVSKTSGAIFRIENFRFPIRIENSWFPIPTSDSYRKLLVLYFVSKIRFQRANRPSVVALQGPGGQELVCCTIPQNLLIVLTC